MLTPFLRLLQLSTNGASPRSVLLAASGPSLRVFDFLTGQFISKWSHVDIESLSREGTTGSQDEDTSESPAKKRKINNGNTSDTPSAEILIENGSGRRKPSRRGSTAPSITHLLGTADGKYVVVVTGEDKAIRVLSMSARGTLRQSSQRILPKRLSALTLTPDESNILCADKFGDVYSLPLLGKPYDTAPKAENAALEDAATDEMFKPSASLKTVHTKRNLRALESQQKQKKVKKQSREDSRYENELILGHVSLLTDIACVRVKSDTTAGRTYILTADRDEHIRVSRGIPQAHMIENFCLGHDQFISKMHVPSWQPETLVSGGGDEYLLVWKWREGLVRQKICFKEHLSSHESSAMNSVSQQVAISGIWSMQTHSGGQIIVACEASCSLLFFGISVDGSMESAPSFQATLSHNILDVAVSPSESSITVALDNVHKAETTHEATIDGPGDFVVRFKFNTAKEGGTWSRVDDGMIGKINEFAKGDVDYSTGVADAATLGDSFYNIEHLRKRRDAEADAEAAAEGTEVAP